MILPEYQSYKDSGAQWLGRIPAHWDVINGRRLFRHRKEKMRPGDQQLTTSQKYGVIPQAEFMRRENQKVMSVFIGSDILRHVEPGDFVISMRSFQGGLEWCGHQGCVSSAYVALAPVRGIDAGFFRHLFKSQPYIRELQSTSNLVRDGQALRFHNFTLVPLPLVPMEEQRLAGRFLDHADRRIRRYIRAKQKLIKLLEEQKQAIIHQAVTRGLDPNVRLQPSGVEWLGDVPEHWTVGRLKDAARVQTGLTLGKKYEGAATESRPYLRVANVQAGRVDLRQVKRVEVPQKEASGATLRVGDVLMTEGGDIDKLGRGCVWHGEVPDCLHQNHVFAVRCRREILVPEFLVGLMASLHGRAYFQLTAKQTTNLASTNSTTLRAFPVPLPPVTEQMRILEDVASRTEGLDVTMTRADTEISFLREYRTRLVADVVTGKLDVRDAAARLPPETEEPQLPDETDSLSDGEADESDDLDAEPEEADE